MTDRNPNGSEPPGPGTGPVDLTLLRTFLAVHRAGSFTAGAKLLGLSQPTVTTQVRALEERLGRQLFERLPRGVASTAVADQLAADVAGPLDALAAVAGGRDHFDRRIPAEPVHLAGPAELLCVLALPALAPLADRGVRLRITTGLTDDLLEGLRAGRYDLVVSTTRPRGRSVTAVPLMDEEFVLVAAPAWAERIGPGRVAAEGPSALRDAPLISYADDLPIARRYWRHVFGTRLTGQAAITIPDLRGVLAAVVAGAGFSVLPRYLCLGELASGAIVALLEPGEPPINTGYLAQRPGAGELPHVALVRDHLLRAGRTW
ncbi:LysR family transcriptional regulator [Streptomyces sp. H10-C2]|uniref:LysR family transcriptional regulator n=1 Tax=unclassified Streptomyces TaxID=2593676 RepID=UPI0024BB77FA|nr:MULTISPECIES: LysR family transcriptional regulator [unclassified Streptomyces]MDJ0344086.1 LysR family transcriptional regulator [Streptomyces sp. PH10-H1]MDJ0368625.1 LysR family transcriptional regulator [Streptomyces sp. H10-C2]